MFSGSSEGLSILLLAWAQTLAVILDQNFLPHYSHLFHQQILLTLLHSKSKLWLLLMMSAITPKSSTIFFPPELTFLLSLIPPSPSVFNHSHSKLKKKKNQMMSLFCSKTSCDFLSHTEQKCPYPHHGLWGTIIWPLDASWTSWPTLSFTNLSHSKFQASTPPQGLFICFFSS